MNLLRSTLVNPVYKRVTRSGAEPDSELEPDGGLDGESDTASPATEVAGSRRRPAVKMAMLVALVVAAVAIRRRRS